MRFEKYFEPKSVSECCALLSEYGRDAKLLAGGTDLVPRMKAKMISPKTVIALHRIPGLDGLEVKKDGVTIGACMPLRKLSMSPELNRWPALKEAAGHVSSMQIRNVATLGGNACNASPSADAVEGLMIYDAMVNIVGAGGERQVPIADFFIGPGMTVLEAGEMVASFFVPVPADNSGAAYKKFAIRGDTDISIVGAGAYLRLDAKGIVTDVRISLASVAPTPLRAKAAEKYITGKTVTEETARQAGEIAAGEAKPISDPRASAGYRLDMVKVWVKNALIEAAAAVK